MPNVLNEFVGDGVTRTFNFSMTGGYLSRDYVFFYTRPNEDLLAYTPYNDDDVTWISDYTVRTAAPIPVGTTFVILRSTTLDPLVDFQNTSRITEKNLDTATWQSIHIAAETSDMVGRIQVVATDAKLESADALLNAQAAADDAQTAASAAIAASQAAGAAQAAALQAGVEAGAAALSAQAAALTATAAEGTANSAASAAATAVSTANTALTAANSAVGTANAADAAASAAVATATSANATAGVAASDASSAVSAATTAVGTANTAMSVANEAKSLIDEAVSGAVVSFNGRAGIVTPEVGDYTKAMVGLGDVDNTSDASKPVSDATASALADKVDKVAGKQLSTEDYTSAEKTKLGGIAYGATANSPDEDLRDRATHTGTQAPATIAGLPQWQANPTGVHSINGGQIAGMRNKIINGKMDIAQRGTSFPAIANGTYSMDRWLCGLVSSGAVTITQQADAPSNNEFQYSLRATVTAADTTIAAGDNARIIQRIEGYNVRDLIGRTFTISFRVRSSKTGIHCVALGNTGNNGSDRGYIAEYTINAANTWETKTITVVGGLPTAGTWNYLTGVGLEVNWLLACGSTFHTTAGAWQVGGFLSTPNQVNCLDTVGNIFAITGVQLEVGEVATPFEHRPYGLELALCQRYYKVYQFRSTVTAPAADYYFTVNMDISQMRAAPTVNWTMISTSNAKDFVYAGRGQFAWLSVAFGNIVVEGTLVMEAEL